MFRDLSVGFFNNPCWLVSAIFVIVSKRTSCLLHCQGFLLETLRAKTWQRQASGRQIPNLPFSNFRGRQQASKKNLELYTLILNFNPKPRVSALECHTLRRNPQGPWLRLTSQEVWTPGQSFPSGSPLPSLPLSLPISLSLCLLPVRICLSACVDAHLHALLCACLQSSTCLSVYHPSTQLPIYRSTYLPV